MIEKIVVLLLAGMLVNPTNAGVGSNSSLSVNDVAGDLSCTCGCAMILSVCRMSPPCEPADRMRSQIQLMIDEGKSKEQIINAMLQIYGEEILANPPKTGFNLTLWLYPIVGVTVGSLIVYAISKKRKSAEWYADPDEVLEMNEDEFVRIEAEKEKIALKYEGLLEKTYKKLKVEEGEENRK